MESRISDILNRMDRENAKLLELKADYLKCKVGRKAKCINVNATLCPAENNGTMEQMHLRLSGEIVGAIMDLIEAHYTELGKKHRQNLEDMVEEMKQEQ